MLIKGVKMKFLIGLMLLFLVGCTCPGVIGVGYDDKGYVDYVYRSGPAINSGIKIGDQLLDIDSIYGPAGKEVTFSWLHGKEKHSARIKRMCYYGLGF